VGIPLIQQAKIQAQVLLPLVKALQAEMGKERANALVRRALGDLYRRYGEEFWRTKNEKNLGKSMASAFATFAREDALDYRVREQSQDAFEIDVRDAGTLSSTRSWVSRSSDSCWSAARTSPWPRDLIPT
jgi:L-2-amino-thiazoline-4-carboxylic acid hydrolase